MEKSNMKKMKNTDLLKQYYSNLWIKIIMSFVLLFVFFCGCSAIEVKGTESTIPSMLNYTFNSSGGKTTGSLKIRRIELNFSNNRGEITVPLNSGLYPYAIIRFDGNGLFRATWEIDGRILEEVAINITFGRTLTLHIRKNTVLPTFEPGLHRITLKVHEPSTGFKIPVITYFVTGDGLDN